MANAFLRTRSEDDANSLVQAAFLNDRPSSITYQSPRDRSLLTVNMAEEELEALGRAGVTVYPDIEFQTMGPERTPRRAPLKEMLEFTGGLEDVLNQIRAPQAWEKARGAGVTIAIVDTGICGTLKEFPASKRSPLDLPTSYSGSHWNDVKGHGSMCASIAAGTKASGGVFNGVAPDATVLSARTTLLASDVFQIFDRLISAKITGAIPGPLVISNSYGLYTCAPPAVLPEDHPYLDMVRDAVRRGIPVVFAAGNNHWDVLCNHDPLSCGPNTIWAVNSDDSILSVGTVNRAESNRDPSTPHPNSSRGPGQWARTTIKPDCVAPTYGAVVWGCGYTTMDWWGTSGACPQVAGLAALILSKNPALSAHQVYDVIRSSCRALPDPKECVGSGIIDCAAAIAATP